MSRAMAHPYPLSQRQARRVWLHAQGLDVHAPFGGGAEATRLAVEHLGYVQIDTIHVIERCHHHILHSRIPSYERGHLRQAQSVDKTVFEYWTHALAYVPTRDLRFFVGAMKQHRKNTGTWLGAVTPQELRGVIGQIKAQGPLSIRDMDDAVLVDKTHLWASRKPSQKALQLGFYNGLLAISERRGMLKTYELMERHFGGEKLPKAASTTETMGYLLDRALQAQGVVSLDSICHLNAGRKAAVRKVIDARVRRGSLVRVALEGDEKTEYWMEPGWLERRFEEMEPVARLLSPFDPLIIQRKRLQRFFGYEHVFEAYLPKEKRRFGYFALPVLVRDEVVAAIDLKTDRQNQKLCIQQWHWVGNGADSIHRPAIEAALDDFERFQLGN
ncbi:winged helix-turn-helix domain-containing protein [Phragmitibacter flavus]|uniref:Winged helix-turn-helix domain-containing protein n=1 Tax=Phragmitibacter flavus TaxID=2576071 RepID=A0A5R8KJQ6_9BACT|nr:winged helix-turn-helix domain-containing protein [Phragmitibacter flavus]